MTGCVFTSASAMMWSENSKKCRNHVFDRPLVRVEAAAGTLQLSARWSSRWLAARSMGDHFSGPLVPDQRPGQRQPIAVGGPTVLRYPTPCGGTVQGEPLTRLNAERRRS